MEYFDLLNSRKYALIIWLVVFFAWAILKKEIRNSFFGIFKTLAHRVFLCTFTALFLYLAFIIFLFSEVGLWNTTLIPETVFWFFGSAIVILFSVNDATQDNQFFKKIITNNLKLLVAIEFLVNVYTFHLVVELILLPIILLIVGVSALAETKKEYAQVKKFTDVILIAFGFFLIIFALFKVFVDYQGFATLTNLQSFILPPLLTLTYIPFLYVIALFMAYETLFVRLNLFTKENKNLRPVAKRKIILLCHLNLWKLNKFSKSSIQQLISLSTADDVEIDK